MKRLPFMHRPFFTRRVIEIGGGHDPFWGVTHAVDKFPEDDAQRAGPLRLGKGVVFQQGDLESIPLPGEPKFDFLYASHVLEHVFSVDKAVAEINRVARRGYLETPSPVREQILCPYPYDERNDFHTQFCWTGREPNTIHFIKKSKKTVGEFCGCGNGKRAELIFNLKRRDNTDVDLLMPRDAKTITLYFKGPLQARVHGDFKSACREGACGYSSVVHISRRLVPPFYLFSTRYKKLKNLMAHALKNP